MAPSRSKLFIDINDPRISHLTTHKAFTVQGPLLNHTTRVLAALAPRPGVAVVYCFDGELDDQLRLEAVCLNWSSSYQSELIIVAGRRIDGDDTYDEMAAVVTRTLQCEVRKDGTFTGPGGIRIINGPPITTVNDHGAVIPKAAFELQQAGHALVKLIGARRFVFHNNTSFTLLHHLLNSAIEKQLNGATFTCSTARTSDGLHTGANARWNLPAFDTVLEYARTASIPFVSLHGSLFAWKHKILSELPGWAATVLQPVDSEKTAHYMRKMARSGMGVSLRWASEAFAIASGMKGNDAYANLVQRTKDVGCQVDPARPKGSDEWVKLAARSPEKWGNLQAKVVSHRFQAMAGSCSFPLSNTVGDLSGVPLDVFAPKKRHIIILKAERFDNLGMDGKLHRGFHAHMGREGCLSRGGLFFLAYAKERETLGAVWSAIRASRAAQGVKGSCPVLDPAFMKEWSLFCHVMQPMLQGTLRNIKVFPGGSREHFEKAVQNIQAGEMNRLTQPALRMRRTLGEKPALRSRPVRQQTLRRP